MSLFLTKQISYLGVDIGSASVKMIELTNKGGQAVLKNYGFAEKLEKIESTKTEDMIKRSAEIIKQVYKESGFTSKNVVAALHNFDVFNSVLNIPKTNLQELENVIKVEAHKFVPIPLEDVVLDWKVLPSDKRSAERRADLKESDRRSGAPDHQEDRPADKSNKHQAETSLDDLSLKESEGIDVLLTAAPRRLVKKYLDIFKTAELNILSLETESFAYTRSLLDKNDQTSLMIIDIGAAATDVIIVERQIPVIIRTVDGGGMYITEEIANNLGINHERAEQFKRDVGFFTPQADTPDNSQIIKQLIESAFVPIVNEVNYSLDLYQSQGKSIDRIVLSGGSAYLLHLVDFFKSTFKLPVYIGDPWHRVNYPDELRKMLEEIGPMFAVAVGLALKPIVE